MYGLCTGGLGSIGLGGLGTLSGLNRQTPAVKTAAERAAEAAARIPDPPAGTPRQKPKSVTFVEDGELACVRYFLKVGASVSHLPCRTAQDWLVLFSCAPLLLRIHTDMLVYLLVYTEVEFSCLTVRL